MDPAIRRARSADLPRLHPLIERAYRGDSARAGWSHEADLVGGARTDLATLQAIVGDPASRLLIAERAGDPLGCVHVADRGDGLAYLGLLTVEPRLQAAGLGRRLLAAGEAAARDELGATRIEMTVIDVRAPLIAWYARRGYALTGERRPFPIATERPLAFVVLEKRLAQSPCGSVG